MKKDFNWPGYDWLPDRRETIFLGSQKREKHLECAARTQTEQVIKSTMAEIYSQNIHLCFSHLHICSLSALEITLTQSRICEAERKFRELKTLLFPSDPQVPSGSSTLHSSLSSSVCFIYRIQRFLAVLVGEIGGGTYTASQPWLI